MGDLERESYAVQRSDAVEVDVAPSPRFMESVREGSARTGVAVPEPLEEELLKPIQAPLSILLVEDNPGDIRLAREVFERGTIPVQLMIAHDGQEALSLLQRGSRLPELILLDLNLPGTDGRAILRRIKSDPALMRIPVVVLTHSNAPQDIRGAYDRHANCYLVKPTDFASFERALQRLAAFWIEVAQLPSR